MILDVVTTGLIFATGTLVAYNIYEAIRHKGLKYKPFQSLAKNLKFSDEVRDLLWKTAKYRINQLANYSKNGQINKMVGIEIDKASVKVEEQIRSGLPKDYLCFVSYKDKKQKNLGIIKGKDKYLIPKAMQTNGDTHGMTNARLIEELKKLDKIAPFTITGAGYDWIEVHFSQCPEDIGLVIDQLMELLPPQDDAATSRAKLEEDLKSNANIFIWWPLSMI